MTDKEVRKLSKVQLLEILYLLSHENDLLREENENLKSRLDALVGEAIAIKRNQSAEETPTEESQ